ncbi:LEA type 2 family protein [Methanoplanus sp. FWC-SCC4]|uniref:LEA type 2 family protein n=1 Tax=Methanochimaera problematica TaxID=2609417 RepID=A0AA97FD36_9EURY|nr:LEA type 2 family protein [Methanoplanus sp. FWC-SCC4]WOF17195.1 LEA type 2 family protein [Methanoplanus sp. FWC-SCC4]
MSFDKKPKVNVKSVMLTDVSFQKTGIIVTIDVFNPLPLGVTLKDLRFSVNLLENDSTGEIIGRGFEKDIRINGNGVTEINVPASLENRSLVSAALGFISGDVIVKVTGDVTFDLKLFSPVIPFEETKTISGFSKRFLIE